MGIKLEYWYNTCHPSMFDLILSFYLFSTWSLYIAVNEKSQMTECARGGETVYCFVTATRGQIK